MKMALSIFSDTNSVLLGFLSPQMCSERSHVSKKYAILHRKLTIIQLRSSSKQAFLMLLQITRAFGGDLGIAEW